jgi:hypothetical protein
MGHHQTGLGRKGILIELSFKSSVWRGAKLEAVKAAKGVKSRDVSDQTQG